LNYKECQQEPSILEALRTGNWNDSHSQHLNDCSDCRETVDVARWMRLLAQGLREPLPDAKIVWLRAQIAGETARRDRVLAPVMLAHILVQVIIGVCSAAWLFWKWPEIGPALTRLVAIQYPVPLPLSENFGPYQIPAGPWPLYALLAIVVFWLVAPLFTEG
jgi:hypothetical protein